LPYKAISSRDHLKLIKRRFGIGTWSYDIKADRFEWSYGLRRVLRVESFNANGLADFLDMAHPDDRQVLEDKIRTGLNVETAPLRMKAADGAQLWLEFHMEVMSENDKPFVVFGAAQDVTTVRNAQFAYLQRGRLSLSLVSLLDAIVWYVSPTGVLDYEVGWCSFTGTKPSDNNGYGWLNFIHPDDREHSKAALEKSLLTKSAFLTTHKVRRSDGTYHVFQATGAPVLDDHGEIMELIGVARRVFDEEKLRPPSMTTVSTPWAAEDYRCARAVLGWSLETLAAESGVSASTIKRMESDEPRRGAIRQANHVRLRAAFESAGVSLSWDGDVRVIRQRPPAPGRLNAVA
jgi:PAS domain S-box-containing protein